jgi:hypothetical protein
VTGFVDFSNDYGTRTVEMTISDTLIINVIPINGAGTVQINTPNTSDNGILLGSEFNAVRSPDNFATKDFVEKLFLQHSHMTGAGPTSPPFVGASPVLPTIDSDGNVAYGSSSARVTTTKVRGE